MSTPPQEPTNPQDPVSGAQGKPAASGEQPQYGQNAPGQNPVGQAPETPNAAGSYSYPGSGGEAAAPYAPGAYGSAAPAGPVATPKYVNLAFWLFLGSALLFVIGGIVNIMAVNSSAGREMLRKGFETQGQTLPSGTTIDQVIDLAVGATTGFIIFMMVVVVITYPLWAMFFRKGKGWARIMATIFAAVAIFLGFFFAGPILGPIAIILGIVAVILLYIGDSAAYFRKAPQN